jgi:hypothetical protein
MISFTHKFRVPQPGICLVARALAMGGYSQSDWRSDP